MDKVSIGKKIRAARIRLGLSQAEFARRVGTSEKTLSSWHLISQDIHRPV